MRRLDVDALLDRRRRLRRVELHAVRVAGGRAVRMAEVQVPRPDVVADGEQAVAVGVGVLVAGEAVRGPVHLARVADEHRVLAVDDVRDGPGGVPGDVPDGHRGAAAEVEGLAAAQEHRRLELAGDDRLCRGTLMRRALRVLQVLVAHAAVQVDVRLAAAQQVRVGLVDDDLGASPGHLPQGVRAADVVDVAVGEQDPAHVLDASAERRQGRGHALGGRRGDARVDDRQLRGVDEEAVEVEATPRRGQRVDRRAAHRLTRQERRRPPRRRRSTPGSRRSAGRTRAWHRRTG